MKYHEMLHMKSNAQKGSTFVEVLACFCIVSLSIAGILEIYACAAHTFIFDKIYYLGQAEMHNKIEEFYAIKFFEIRAGIYQDTPYFFMERKWKVTKISNGFEICVKTVSTGGFELSHRCIMRTAYE